MAILRDPRPERSSRPRLGVLSISQAEAVGHVVLMDNLGAHKGQRVRELIEGRGCKLLYLPPYSSPDFNPFVQSDCEEAFSKIKGFVRQIGARTREALVEAIGKALDTVTAKMRGASSFVAVTVCC